MTLAENHAVTTAAAADGADRAAPDAANFQYGKTYTNYALGLLLGVSVFNLIDRTVVNLLLVPIAQDLHLADWQLGVYVGTAFAAFYALAQIPIARIADRSPRRGRVIALALAFWSGMTAMQSFAVGFITLIMARAGVAIGEAGSGPASHSLVADFFPPSRRARAFAILSFQLPLGAAIGAFVGGFAREWLGWRLTLALVGVPGLVFAVIVWLTLREPTRGYWQARVAEPSASLRDTVRFLLGLAAFRHTLAGYTIWVIVAGSAGFDPVYLERVFAFSPRQIGSLFGISGMLAMSGYYLGGWLCDRMTVHEPRWALRLAAMFLLVGLVTSSIFYLAPNRATVVALVFIGPLLPAMLPLIFATVQNLSPASMRARASALLLTVSTLVGMGLGAALAGTISGALAPRYGNESIRYALLMIAWIGLSWAALHFWLGSRTLTRDLLAKDRFG